jgi:hypothetical protein
MWRSLRQENDFTRFNLKPSNFLGI